MLLSYSVLLASRSDQGRSRSLHLLRAHDLIVTWNLYSRLPFATFLSNQHIWCCDHMSAVDFRTMVQQYAHEGPDVSATAVMPTRVLRPRARRTSVAIDTQRVNNHNSSAEEPKPSSTARSSKKRKASSKYAPPVSVIQSRGPHSHPHILQRSQEKESQS